MSTPPQDRADLRAQRRARRRATLGTQIDTTIPSPCISVCQIDSATGECLGCRRTVEEIRDWIIMTATEKTAVLDEIAHNRTKPDHE